MSWLGKVIGAVAAAPARLLNIPIKALEASVGEKSADNVLDHVGDAVKEAAEKTVDGKETE